MTTRPAYKFAKCLVLLLVLVGAFVAFPSLTRPAASAAEPQRGEFMVVNQSSYTFMRLYLSSSTRRAWGPDQLGRKTIAPGNSFTLNSIPCGLYDVKLVDEDGDACIVTEVPMCRNHTHWEVTNSLLASCEGY